MEKNIKIFELNEVSKILKNLNILILGSIAPEAISDLEKDSDYKVVNLNDTLKHKKNYEELKNQAFLNCDLVITRSETRVDKDFLDKMPKLKMVMRAAVGVANIDLNECSSRGIVVANSPALNSTSAAEQAFLLLMCSLRNTYAACENMKRGGWNRHLYEGRELRGKIVALAGLGNVGSLMARYCLCFGAKVRAYDPYISNKKFQTLQVQACSNLEELCKNADILSLHTPLNSETREMIGREHIELMARDVVIINAARGGLINEDLLVDLLKKNRISKIGVDTFDSEPDYHKALASHKNVICTPHIGASTNEAKSAIGAHVLAQVRKFSRFQTVETAVNADFSLQGVSAMMRSYAVLSEKLGFILAQIITKDPGSDNRISKMKLILRGDLSLDEGETLLKTRFCMGYLQNKTERFISMINAVSVFSELEIELEFLSDPDFRDYRSALKIEVFNDKNDTLRTIGGVVFGDDELRFTTLDHFAFDLTLSGNFLALRNEDKPGVVGEVGSYLGSKSINIESFYLAKKPGDKKEALSIMKIDRFLEAKELKAIENLDFIYSARSFYI